MRHGGYYPYFAGVRKRKPLASGNPLDAERRGG